MQRIFECMILILNINYIMQYFENLHFLNYQFLFKVLHCTYVKYKFTFKSNSTDI